MLYTVRTNEKSIKISTNCVNIHSRQKTTFMRIGTSQMVIFVVFPGHQNCL